jgi:Fe2+ or Zn2+ uptake regulation protein
MKQQRSTRQRQLVLDAVRARHDHPTADQIYLDVRAR